MSRALDQSVKEAITKGNHQKVFEAISGILSQCSAELFEIELLGPSHVLDPNTYYLQDGNAIAIPKIRLVQAFLFARRILIEHRNKEHDENHDLLLKATSVILLMDPEHLTAANTRKRFLSDAAAMSYPDLEERLLKEKYYVDSVLTSRLHRHTKSPTLWGHRQWLMERMRNRGLSVDLTGDLGNLVFVAAERHPRNYYAWSHARYLTAVTLLQPDLQSGKPLSTAVEVSKRWCLAHHNDVSGWAFLMFLLSRCSEQVAPVFNEILKVATSFQWRNESVWYFLRNVVLLPAIEEHQRQEFHVVRLALKNSCEEDADAQRILDRALHWVESVTST